MIKELERDLKKYGNQKKGELLQRFFKTGRGEYGEGDRFLGLTQGQNRDLAKKYQDLSLSKVQELLKSGIHEKRMIALLILIHKFRKANEKQRDKIFSFYVKNSRRVNNWDLVDLSAPYIPGMYLVDKDRKILYKFAKSDNLWEKRISIISCFAFIRDNDFKDALKISDILINDEHDLIHKAVGWMLREIGKKDMKTEEDFLRKKYKKMPRTMLRYAIEKFPEELRLKYLKSLI
jgi:3-methyladenine DNA glycosylase AlkD